MSKRTAPPPKKVLSIAVRLDVETKNALDELARADERTTSDYMRRALRQHVEQERGKSERKGGG